MRPLTQAQIEEGQVLVQKYGSIKAAARATGIPFGNLQKRVAKAKQAGRASVPQRQEFPLPPRGKVARYIFTCAQSNTHIHAPTWRSLETLAAHYGARICVSQFTYAKETFGEKSVKPGKGPTGEDQADLWFAKEVLPHVLDESALVAPGLVWCGEMNILPTAVRPLSGLESYTGRKSGIFPHVKIAMESIASAKTEPTKFNYTTGTVTLRNYVAKKAGLKAEFHHSYGGLLVEVDSDGSWWCRQLNADSEGTIHDLDIRVRGKRLTTGNRIEAVNWGDIHCGTIAPAVDEACFGYRGILDTLRPRYQLAHDVLDFRSQNHHDRKNFHQRFKLHLAGQDDVIRELHHVALFLLDRTQRHFCETIVVDSNHDNALTRWLREADYRTDPKNAVFFLEAQLETLKAIEAADNKFHLVSWAVMRLADPSLRKKARIKFLRQDESFIICPDANGGIECGMHGHNGPNGAKGSPAAFARMGRKSNIGHTHSACIHDGTYVAGVTGALDQGYNVGPSSWSHSNIITYPNGKRAIVTIWEGKWRA